MADINQVQLPDGSQYNIKDSNSGYATETYVQNQISGITKATIGLGNVDNTSDMNKPVSTAQQTALNGKTNTSVIAYTESSATATKRYEIGDQFILNGVLYTATAIIPNGDPIVVDTNCSASDTVTTQIDTVKASDAAKANKSDLTSISETGSTASQAISAGTYFYLDGTLVKAKTAIASGVTFTLNTNYEVVTAGALNDKFNWEIGVAKPTGESYAGKDIYRAMYATGNLAQNAVITLDANLKNIKVLRWGGYINAGNNVFPLPYTNVTNIGYDIQVQINSSNGLVVICGSYCEATWAGIIWLDYFIP